MTISTAILATIITLVGAIIKYAIDRRLKISDDQFREISGKMDQLIEKISSNNVQIAVTQSDIKSSEKRLTVVEKDVENLYGRSRDIENRMLKCKNYAGDKQ